MWATNLTKVRAFANRAARQAISRGPITSAISYVTATIADRAMLAFWFQALPDTSATTVPIKIPTTTALNALLRAAILPG